MIEGRRSQSPVGTIPTFSTIRITKLSVETEEELVVFIVLMPVILALQHP